jgi:anti-sigma-K factor RskA
MKYTNAQLRALATEYVLGTLRGAARRRFAAIAAANLDARRILRRTEIWFSPLALRLRPVKPPAPVWDDIARQVGEGSRGSTRVAAPWAGWRVVALAASVATVALATTLATRPPRIETRMAPPRYIAIVVDAKRPLWLLTESPEGGTMRALAIGMIEIDPTRSFELWSLPDDGGAPVSLGLLQTVGESSLMLSSRAREVLAGSSTVAVSVEPRGGSPTGAPTGPVVYTAPLVRNTT